jgi:AcrR family transcriptional regulator
LKAARGNRSEKVIRNGSKSTKKIGRAKRLPAAEREKMIIEGAIHFFAKEGFSGRTRDLAAHLGITQPLLYRYFPTKGHLMERIYHEMVFARWNPTWTKLLKDREQDLAHRLTMFYSDYAHAIFSYENFRVFLYMWLRGENVKKQFLRSAHRRLFRTICRELRATCGLPSTKETPILEQEEELAWALHGNVIYLGFREFVFHLPAAQSREELIGAYARMFVEGASKEMARLHGAKGTAHKRLRIHDQAP